MQLKILLLDTILVIKLDSYYKEKLFQAADDVLIKFYTKSLCTVEKILK